MRTSSPARARAGGRPLSTSPSPPDLWNGETSAETCTTIGFKGSCLPHGCDNWMREPRVSATASNPPPAPRDWSVRDVVAWTTDDLRKRGIDSARVDAELIVAHALGIDRVKVVLSAERALTP